MSNKKLPKNVKRKPAIKREPKPAFNQPTRNRVIQWKRMRRAEQKRKNNIRSYSRYKNSYFISIVKEATGVEYWTKYDLNRLKVLRRVTEETYNIPINFLYSFIYYSTYFYLKWPKRSQFYSNYVGFISAEFNLVRFANFLSSRPKSWRRRKSKWPEDFGKKWGMRTSINVQKLGFNDELVEVDLFDKKMDKKMKEVKDEKF